ncbi:MAG: hypothetical protein IJK97_08220 [Thermoguttaceae bacterium]|nr:hypothetical protein [Thermoguttaceae bacterium]
MALFVIVLAGLFFLIWGVRLLTPKLPPLPEEAFAPRLNPPAQVHMQKSQEQASPAVPETVHLNVDGETVQGTVQ